VSEAAPPRAAVIDDDPTMRQLVTTILGTRGWRSQAFADAPSALEELDASSFDVVVCDLGLPGFGGDRLCEVLRERLGRSAPPVVMISGANDEVRVGRALDSGAWHYVRKPFGPGELVAIVDRAVRSAGRPRDDEPPTRLGRYELTGELGRGGMGVVYRARRGDEPAAPEVALKVLPPLRATAEDVLRFRRELDVLAALAHPGIARLIESGQDDGRTWFAMELVAGRSLASLLVLEGALDWARAARLVRALAATLAYVHGRGLVHRDVKPANVIVTPDDRPRLVDFGLARRPLDLALTSPSVLVGTPMYMAPELGSLAAPSPASDVFGLGLVLHELLAGRPPLDPTRYAHAPLAVLLVYARGELVAPCVPAGRRPLPPALTELVAHMTRPAPGARPSALDVAQGLARLLRDHGEGEETT
jgi:CheY-like chemotaxis protein